MSDYLSLVLFQALGNLQDTRQPKAQTSEETGRELGTPTSSKSQRVGSQHSS